MARKKHYIVSEVAALLGSSPNYVYTLLKEGKLSGYKCASGKWLIPKEQGVDWEALKVCHVDTQGCESDRQPVEPFIRYVADDEHYSEVFARMNQVRRSLKLTSANLKNFNVYFDKKSKDDPIKFCDFLLILLNRGIKVQILCMKPFGFYAYCKEHLPELIDHPGLEIRQNDRNHMKVFIFDDECAYVGSANLTGAAIGRRSGGSRNHEAGILAQSNDIFQSAKAHFESVWNDPDTIKSNWHRFENKRKEFVKTHRK